MATATDPSEVFVQYRPGRRGWLKLLAVLGTVLLLLALVYSVRLTGSSPTAVVNAYFQALADRDLAAALRVLDAAVVGEDPPPELLTAAVLSSEDYAPPEDVEIAESTVDDRRAFVEVRFTIAGRQAATSLELRRGSGVADNLRQRWRIVDGVRELRLGEAPGQVTVNGVLLWAHDIDASRSLPALFGGYQVGVPPDDPLWDARTIRMLVGPDQTRPVDVPMVPRPEVRAEIERQRDALLDECAARNELAPPGCPFSHGRILGATGVAWQITSYPQLRLISAPDGLADATMRVQTTTDGEAVLTGTQVASGTERPFEIVVSFRADGAVVEQAGRIVFEADW